MLLRKNSKDQSIESSQPICETNQWLKYIVSLVKVILRLKLRESCLRKAGSKRVIEYVVRG